MNLTKNIIIEASAGTGKTYALVQAILRSLFEKNLPMDSLVALTFTKKAAGEMKERIAGALRAIVKAKTLPEEYQSWGHRLDELQSRARLALEAIDRANISTIHSFAYGLLKRFPLEAGIDPNAEVDEKGIHYDDFFEEAWGEWLARELGRAAVREKEWLETLARAHLDSIKSLARRLCDFDMPVFKLPISDENLTQDLAPYLKEIRGLIAGKPDQKATRVAIACEEILSNSSSPTASGGGPIDDVTATKAWPAEEIKRLKLIQAIARNVVLRGDQALATMTLLLRPFVSAFRAKILAEGYLSNSALLYLARELVRKNHEVRSLLKREIRMIFVDEFQDTDPLQGELILFLAEAPAGHAKAWKDVLLEAGKLFIVGDPKQSIYRFRGADIAAYRQITERVVKQGGQEISLNQSRRSHDQIIGVVNSAFQELITENPPISPAYQALQPLRLREDLINQNVELRLAASGEKQKSDEALEKEAQDAAEWITKNVTSWRYRDIALIFRSTPAMRPFVSALRQYEIPFVVEGERYFYSAPEVTDVINLLRILDDPNDAISLVGFLRSPLGGFTDPEIVELKQAGWTPPMPSSPADSGRGSMGSPPVAAGNDRKDHAAKIFSLIRHLQARVQREPLKDVLRHIFDDTYLLELAARSYHRDQTVANLQKLKRLLESFAEEGVTTLRSLLAKVASFMEEDRVEGESPLADETYDAVRLMTIHKAKGLEFPVVWLPGLHAGAGGYKPTAELVYDWSQDRFGVRLDNGLQNFEKFRLDQETRQREEAEEKRVLYVAMTRARERLILSGGTDLARPSKESFLAQLAAAWKINLETVAEGDVSAGTHQILVTRIKTAALSKNRPAGSASVPFLDRLDPAPFAAAWKARAEACAKAMESPLVTTPTSVGAYPRIGVSASEEEPDVTPTPRHADTPARIGTLIHRFLEHWDFACGKGSMPAKLRQVANAYFAQEGLTEQPNLVKEAQKILADFIGSAAWEEIKGSTILGREVPFFCMANVATGNEQRATGQKGSSGTHCALPIAHCAIVPLMRGAIDILYRLPTGQLIIGDYKTSSSGLRIQDSESHYAAQGAAYREAVSRALGEKAAFKIISITLGTIRHCQS